MRVLGTFDFNGNFNGKMTKKIKWPKIKKSELSFPWVKMLNSYIFVIRKQNATRKYNVLFKKTTLKFSH